MEVLDFIAAQSAERQPLLKQIHDIIIENDLTVEPKIDGMMGKEMIIYNDRDFFKYGLANTKAHLSLHVLPIYMNMPLHEKYVKLLPKAKVQKGCINFKTEEEMPLAIVTQLIKDTAKIDLIAIRAAQLQSKKKKKNID